MNGGPSSHRLVSIMLDWAETGCAPPTRRNAALQALLEGNHCVVRTSPEAGPYHLALSKTNDGQLLLRFTDLGGNLLTQVAIPAESGECAALREQVEMDEATTSRFSALLRAL